MVVIATNVSGLCEGKEIEVQMFVSAQKPNWKTAVDVSTSALLLQTHVVGSAG